jgi:DNA repair ATPase RecN
MSAISPALPNSEQLDKLNEVENRLKRYPHLERCYFASDATIAELRKFYSEIARLQNEDEDIESAFERGITSLKKTIKALRSLERLGLHSKRALVIMGIQPDSSLHLSCLRWTSAIFLISSVRSFSGLVEEFINLL